HSKSLPPAMTRSLLRFFLLAYALSWLIWAPLWLPAFGIDGLPALSWQHALGGFGPMLAALWCSRRYEGTAALAGLLRSMFSLRPALWLLIAFASPFVLNLFAALMARQIDAAAFDLEGWGVSKEFPQLGFAGFFAYNLLFFGWGEETGWRGFALPRLQQHLSAGTSSVLLTVFWALWHWPLFFYRPGYTSMDAAGIFGWVFSLLTGSVLLAWLFNGSRGSVLACAVFHATVDIAFTSDFTRPEMVQYTGFLITVWGIITLLVFGWKNLAQTRRATQLLP
ncbi:MAG TPA: CPBP family intramembrane metalloprotease, partial [Saprospiraceae bacterium]|nr:CPBP family intramembrane metalloprotease [Saprospiraceae bacterium]